MRQATATRLDLLAPGHPWTVGSLGSYLTYAVKTGLSPDAALQALIKAIPTQRAAHRQWGHDRLVMDKWFALQVMEADPVDAAVVADRLTGHPDFNHKNPNRFRAVFGALGMHHAGFHHESGMAYGLLADWLIRLDPLNPQTTARMCTLFQTWKRYDSRRQEMIKAALERIAATEGLSRDTNEMVTRILNA